MITATVKSGEEVVALISAPNQVALDRALAPYVDGYIVEQSGDPEPDPVPDPAPVE